MLEMNLDEVRRAVSILYRVERAICVGHEYIRAGIDGVFDDCSVGGLCCPSTAVKAELLPEGLICRNARSVFVDDSLLTLLSLRDCHSTRARPATGVRGVQQFSNAFCALLESRR